MAREKTLDEKIEEHNRLGREQPAQRHTAEVRSLMNGRFNGPNLKAIRVSPGMVVTVASPAYARSLVDAGLAEWLPEPEPEVPQETGGEPEAEKPFDLVDLKALEPVEEAKPRRGRPQKKGD